MNSHPNTNEIWAPANGHSLSPKPPPFSWLPFQPQSFEANPFLLWSQYTSKASTHLPSNHILGQVPGRHSQDTSLPMTIASNSALAWQRAGKSQWSKVSRSASNWPLLPLAAITFVASCSTTTSGFVSSIEWLSFKRFGIIPVDFLSA